MHVFDRLYNHLIEDAKSKEKERRLITSYIHGEEHIVRRIKYATPGRCPTGLLIQATEGECPTCKMKGSPLPELDSSWFKDVFPGRQLPVCSSCVELFKDLPDPAESGN